MTEFEERQRERARLQARLIELRPAIAEIRRIQRRLNALERTEVREALVAPSRVRQYMSTEERKLQILAQLDGCAELLRKDIAEALAIGQARAGQLVNLMIDEGLVDDQGPGGLEITDAGRRFLYDRHPERPSVTIRSEVVEP